MNPVSRKPACPAPRFGAAYFSYEPLHPGAERPKTGCKALDRMEKYHCGVRLSLENPENDDLILFNGKPVGRSEEVRGLLADARCHRYDLGPTREKALEALVNRLRQGLLQGLKTGFREGFTPQKNAESLISHWQSAFPAVAACIQSTRSEAPATVVASSNGALHALNFHGTLHHVHLDAPPPKKEPPPKPKRISNRDVLPVRLDDDDWTAAQPIIGRHRPADLSDEALRAVLDVLRRNYKYHRTWTDLIIEEDALPGNCDSGIDDLHGHRVHACYSDWRKAGLWDKLRPIVEGCPKASQRKRSPKPDGSGS